MASLPRASRRSRIIWSASWGNRLASFIALILRSSHSGNLQTGVTRGQQVHSDSVLIDQLLLSRMLSYQMPSDLSEQPVRQNKSRRSQSQRCR